MKYKRFMKHESSSFYLPNYYYDRELHVNCNFHFSSHCKSPSSTPPFEWDKKDFTNWPVCFLYHEKFLRLQSTVQGKIIVISFEIRVHLNLLHYTMGHYHFIQRTKQLPMFLNSFLLDL